MTIPHCHLQQFRVQLPLREQVARALPNSEQSEHWQECGRGKQYRGKLVIIGSWPSPGMHAETSMRPSDQEHSEWPRPPERNEIKISGEHYVVAARHIEG